MRAAGLRSLALSAALGTALLVCGMVLLSHLRWRGDWTAEREYSLAPATLAMIGGLEDRLQLEFYFNRDIEGAEVLLPLRVVLEDLLEEVVAAGQGQVTLDVVDPTLDPVAEAAALRMDIHAQEIPFRDLGGRRSVTLWQGMEMRYLGRTEVLPFLSPAEFEFAFTSSLAALLNPEKSRLAFLSNEPPDSPRVGDIQAPPPPERIFFQLRKRLATRFDIVDLDPAVLQAGDLTDFALVCLARPEAITSAAREILTAYLAQGGRLLVMWDAEAVDPGSFDRRSLKPGLEDWLAGYGLRPRPEWIFDSEACLDLQLPDGQVAYGLWPAMDPSRKWDAHPLVAALPNLHMHWAHPLEVLSSEAEVLLRSAPTSRLLPQEATEKGIWSEKLKALEIAAAAAGPMASFPLIAVVPVSGGGQLLVVGDSDLWTDAAFRQPWSGNGDLAANLFDWFAQETSLLGLRTRGRRQRPLTNFHLQKLEELGVASMSPEAVQAAQATARAYARDRQRWIAWWNALAPGCLLLVLFVSLRARKRKP